MTHFAIHCIDKPDSLDLRLATRAEHLAYLQAIENDILVAGPLLDGEGQPIGSLLIIDFAERKDAVAFAAADPYALVGLFASVAVTAYRKVLPA